LSTPQIVAAQQQLRWDLSCLLLLFLALQKEKKKKASLRYAVLQRSVAFFKQNK
jgi:hypothetical protein